MNKLLKCYGVIIGGNGLYYSYLKNEDTKNLINETFNYNLKGNKQVIEYMGMSYCYMSLTIGNIMMGTLNGLVFPIYNGYYIINYKKIPEKSFIE